jgi:RNA polymerase sigma-70 factor, ECF subfamily
MPRPITLPIGEERRVTREQFGELVERHHADLLRLAFAMSGDRHLAEDAVQACWQEAWRSRDEVRDRDNIRGWLFTVTANKVRRQMRRQRLGEVLIGRIRSPRTIAEVGERNLDLAQAMHRLAPSDRQLLAMRFALGLTSEEIGLQMGLSPSGTRRRLQRVLERLRKDLHDD